MAYTDAWNDNFVLGSTAADLIDNAFRRLRNDISERMDDLTGAGGKWTVNDPVLLPANAASLQWARSYEYDDSELAGDKVSGQTDLLTLLVLHILAEVDAVSQITIDFDTLDENYGLGDLYFETPVTGILRDRTSNDYVFLSFLAHSGTGNSIIYGVKRADGALIPEGHEISGNCMFLLISKPT